MRVTDKYVFFWGGTFSQWAKSPFVQDGITFQTAEHYMMYQKALILKDEDAARRILVGHSPKFAKQTARNIKASQVDLDQWDEVKYSVVLLGNILKFTQNTEMLRELLKYYPEKKFVEASPYDTIWGIGLHEDDDAVLNEDNWRGKNLLGRALDTAATRLYGTDI